MSSAGGLTIVDIRRIKFYFSDDLKQIDRDKMVKKVLEMGGIVREKITYDLWYLVTSNPNKNSEELKKAKSLSTTIIEEFDFIKMIEGEMPFP